MYAKITGGLVEQFPYSAAKLKRDNPNTSYPKNMNSTQLANVGLYLVKDTPAPDATAYQSAYHTGVAIQVNGEWQREWAVRDMFADTTDADGVTTTKAEHEAEYQSVLDASVGNAVRTKRNTLLVETDYFALTDVTMSAVMAAYRQALRDITGHASFPNLVEADWPTKPE
tara:strand:+ start:75 stop:584 length:510 start_codon:yes stop_codon:yes gene_type:complete